MLGTTARTAAAPGLEDVNGHVLVLVVLELAPRREVPRPDAAGLVPVRMELAVLLLPDAALAPLGALRRRTRAA